MAMFSNTWVDSMNLCIHVCAGLHCASAVMLPVKHYLRGKCYTHYVANNQSNKFKCSDGDLTL